MKDSKGRKLRENEAQRKDGMYRYRYTVDGKRYEVCSWRLLKSDKTPAGKKEKPSLREMEEQIQKDLQNGINIAKSKITVNEQCRKYLDSKKTIGIETKLLYERDFIREIKPSSLGKMKIGDVKCSDVLKFYSDVLKKNVSFYYMRTLNNILSPAFNLAVSDHIITINPCSGVLQQFSLKATRHDRIALTKEQQHKLMYFLKEQYGDYYIYVILATFLGTGLRLGELVGLTWDEIDLEEGIINLRHQVVYGLVDNVYKFYAKNPKCDEIRKIPLQDNLLKILKQFYTDTIKIRRKFKTKVDGLTDFVFCSKSGNPITTQIMHNYFIKITPVYKF